MVGWRVKQEMAQLGAVRGFEKINHVFEKNRVNLATYIMDESHEDLYKGNTAWKYLHSLVGKRMMSVLLGIFYSWDIL